MLSPYVVLGFVSLLGLCVAVALVAAVIGFVRARRLPPTEPLPPRELSVLPPLPAPAPVPAPVPAPAPAQPERAAPAPVEPPEPPPARVRLPDWRGGLRKTRAALVEKLESLLRGRAELDPDALAQVEELLYAADLGVRTAGDLLAAARGAGSPDAVRPALEARARAILDSVAGGAPKRGSPHVVLVVGVNGSGKTTSIGKLATRLQRAGQKVVVAAADTFRAAAIDQLAVWAERAGCEIVRGAPGGDPAAVAFDAIDAARARSADVVLIDTAGRLQTDAGLMDELRKISRVVAKGVPEAPHEVLLVLDANTGQNAIRQAQLFRGAVGVTGLILAKIDGTARGGVVLGIAQEVGLPVRYLGVGEAPEDLADFDPAAFVAALFDTRESA